MQEAPLSCSVVRGMWFRSVFLETAFGIKRHLEVES